MSGREMDGDVFCPPTLRGEQGHAETGQWGYGYFERGCLGSFPPSNHPPSDLGLVICILSSPFMYLKMGIMFS